MKTKQTTKHACCPACGGSGKVKQTDVKVSRFQWIEGGKKEPKSFLAVTTFKVK